MRPCDHHSCRRLTRPFVLTKGPTTTIVEEWRRLVKGGYAVASGLLTTIMKDGRGEERRENRLSATNHLVM
jgi:hypothetical protein